MRWLRSLAAFAVLAMGVLVWAEDADARFERFGTRNFAPLFVTVSAANAAAATPDRSSAGAGQAAYPGGSLGGLFNRPGLLGGFAAGFLGAGVLGLLFGHGMVGELGGGASFIGLIFQLALVAMLVRVIWMWWHGGRTAFAGLSPRQLADAYGRPRNELLPNIEPAAGADAGPREKDKE